MGNLVTAYTPTELAALQSVGTFSSTLSLVACIVTLHRIWGDAKVGSLSLATKIVAVLLSINFFYAMATITGYAGSRNATFCTFNGFGIQAFGLATQFWMTVMAWIMYRWIVKKKHPQRLERLIPKSLLTCLTLAFADALIVLSFKMYGPTDTWCWISEQHTNARFYSFYIMLVLAWVWCIVLMIWIRAFQQFRSEGQFDHPGANAHSTVNAGYDVVERSIKNKLTSYIGLYVFCWAFPLINRSAEAFLRKNWYPTSLMQV